MQDYDPQLDAPVWGAANIGKVLNLTPRQAFYALERGLVDADKVGARWQSTIRRLLFNGEGR